MGKKICYLCGKHIFKESRDHVPPQQLYAKSLRKQHNPQLVTLPTHVECNQSFQRDEDYFFQTLFPFALNSPSGKAFAEDVKARIAKGKGLLLVKKVINEFQKRPSGLVLPDGKILKRHDTERIKRIVWKIFRGLYFHHEGKFLSEDTPHKFLEMLVGRVNESKYLPWLATQASKGRYQGIFDYKCLQLPGAWANLWAFLLWDSIVMIMAFQNPQPVELHAVKLSA